MSLGGLCVGGLAELVVGRLVSDITVNRFLLK